MKVVYVQMMDLYLIFQFFIVVVVDFLYCLHAQNFLHGKVNVKHHGIHFR